MYARADESSLRNRIESADGCYFLARPVAEQETEEAPAFSWSLMGR